MPNYDFKCKECGKTKEKYFAFSDKHEVICIKCKTLMVKVIHAAPAHFPGTGWGKNG